MTLTSPQDLPPSTERSPNKGEIDRLKQEYLARLSRSLDFMFSHPYALGSKKLRGLIMDRMEEALGMLPDDELSLCAWANEELTFFGDMRITYADRSPKGGKSDPT